MLCRIGASLFLMLLNTLFVPAFAVVDAAQQWDQEELSEEVKLWRTAYPGLNTVGCCQNKKCAAWQHNVVYHHQNHDTDNPNNGVYELSKLKMRCPNCKEDIAPIIGYVIIGCRYTVTRVQDASQIKDSEWTEVESEHHTIYQENIDTSNSSGTYIMTCELKHNPHIINIGGVEYIIGPDETRKNKRGYKSKKEISKKVFCICQ